MKVTLLLADHAEAVNGKLYVMGGGWSITRPEAGPMAIALKVEVPWDSANRSHKMRLFLMDADGEPVLGSDEKPIEINGEFEVGRPPGLKSGTPLDFVLAVNLGRPELPAGSRFEWRLEIDEESREDWHVQFSTRPK